jgi:hypothetical protein
MAPINQAITVKAGRCGLSGMMRALSYRHAHAGRVEVEIRYDNEQFRLRVRDDGTGIDPRLRRSQAN